jgi:hypothetical protein
MTSYQKQMQEWQEEDSRLFELGRKTGFSDTMFVKKRGHRNKAFDRKNAVEMTIHERVVRNNRRYDGIQKGRKGINPVTAYA